jgi:hypothetical protein
LKLFLVTLLAASASQATIVMRVNVAQQVDMADLIFVGTAVREEFALTGDAKVPFTFVTFSVDQTLKGAAVDRFLTLRFLGGRIGRRALEVEGMPEFQQGQKYLLFVGDNAKAGCPIVGWGQGVLRFGQDLQTRQTVLLDERGAALAGMQGDEWLRGAPQAPPRAGVFYSSAPEFRVLSEDAHFSSRIASENAPAAAAIGADAVLAMVRQVVTRRKSAPTFRVAPAVRSAVTSELPYSLRGAAVAAQ